MTPGQTVSFSFRSIPGTWVALLVLLSTCVLSSSAGEIKALETQTPTAIATTSVPPIVDDGSSNGHITVAISSSDATASGTGKFSEITVVLTSSSSTSFPSPSTKRSTTEDVAAVLQAIHISPIGTTSQPIMKPMHDTITNFIMAVYGQVPVDIETIAYIASLPNNTQNYLQENAWPISKHLLSGHFRSFVACSLIGVILIVLIPSIGLCCCCCRLGNKCGGKTKYVDPPNAKGKRCFSSFVSILLVLFLLVGTVAVFLGAFGTTDAIIGNSNSLSLTKRLNSSASQTNDAISQLLHGYIVAPVGSFSAEHLRDKTLEMSHNGFLNSSVDGLSDYMSKVYLGLSQISPLLSDLAALCENKCNQSALNDLTDKASVMNASLGAMNNTKENILQKYSEILSTIKENVTDALPMTALNSTYGNLEQTAQETLVNMTELVESQMDHLWTPLQYLSAGDDSNVRSYRNIGLYVIFMGVGGLFSLIFLLFCTGLICGCGERAGPDASCRNKGKGANFLLAGVGFSFIFYSLLMLITLVLFASGSLVTSQLCWTMDNPDSVLDQMTKVKVDDIEWLADTRRLLTLYSGCSRDEPSLFFSSLTREQQDIHMDSLFYSNAPYLNASSLEVNMAGTEVLSQDLNSLLNDFDNITLPETSSLNKLITRLRSEQSDNADIQETCSKLGDALVSWEGIHNKTGNGIMRFREDLRNVTFSRVNFTDVIDSVIQKMTSSYPSCKPISTGLKTTTDIFCSDLLPTLNLVWFGMGWCLAFILPIIILSFYIVSLYRRQLPYNKNYTLEEDVDDYDTSTFNMKAKFIPLHNLQADEKGGYIYDPTPDYSPISRYNSSYVSERTSYPPSDNIPPIDYHHEIPPRDRLPPRGAPWQQTHERALRNHHADEKFYY